MAPGCGVPCCGQRREMPRHCCGLARRAAGQHICHHAWPLPWGPVAAPSPRYGWVFGLAGTWDRACARKCRNDQFCCREPKSILNGTLNRFGTLDWCQEGKERRDIREHELWLCEPEAVESNLWCVALPPCYREKLQHKGVKQRPLTQCFSKTVQNVSYLYP